VCGDAFLADLGPAGLLAAVIDGLGHGPESALAAERAVETIRAVAELPVEEMMLNCHESLRTTRGAAIGLLKIDPEGRGAFCGVGNVEVLALAGASPGLFCAAGIVGHNLRRCRQIVFEMRPGDVYCLLSDGVSSRGDLRTALPGTPEEVARRIVDRWGRDHDDATALILDRDTPEKVGGPAA